MGSVPKRAGGLLKTSVQTIAENHLREVKPNVAVSFIGFLRYKERPMMVGWSRAIKCFQAFY